jgi:hypothetical protein
MMMSRPKIASTSRLKKKLTGPLYPVPKKAISNGVTKAVHKSARTVIRSHMRTKRERGSSVRRPSVTMRWRVLTTSFLNDSSLLPEKLGSPPTSDSKWLTVCCERSMRERPSSKSAPKLSVRRLEKDVSSVVRTSCLVPPSPGPPHETLRGASSAAAAAGAPLLRFGARVTPLVMVLVGFCCCSWMKWLQCDERMLDAAASPMLLRRRHLPAGGRGAGQAASPVAPNVARPSRRADLVDL